MPKKKVVLSGPWGSMTFLVKILKEKKGKVKHTSKENINLSSIALNARLVLPRVSIFSARSLENFSVPGTEARKKGVYISR